MYENMITKFAASAGADVPTINLASAPAQRDGFAMSSGRCASATMVGVSGTGVLTVGVGDGIWLGDEGITASPSEVLQVKAAVRVRPLADAHVPGSPPRGAPV